MGFIAIGEPSRRAQGARITGEIWKMDLKSSEAWDLLQWGEPSRLARGARITGEIWKMDIKVSGAWDCFRWGSPPEWPEEPESQARSGKWILKV